jgi:hypothetical protein
MNGTSPPALPFEVNLFEPFRSLIGDMRDQMTSQSSALKSEVILIEQLTKIVESECPSFKDQFQVITERIGHHFRCMEALGEAQMRSVEDLNDLIERSKVVWRASAQAKNLRLEVQKIRGRFLESQNKLERESNPGKREGLITQVDANRELLKNGIERLKVSLACLMTELERFRIFRVRKIRESYFHVGEASQRLMNLEVQNWSDILSCLRTLEESILRGWHDYPETVPILYECAG